MLDVDALVAEGLAAVNSAGDLTELEAARIAVIGRNAPLPLALREVGQLPPAERSEAGRRLNIARQEIEARVAEREKELEQSALSLALVRDRIDVTLPGRAMAKGGLHALTETRREIEDIFLEMGYAIAEGPEIETELNNFTALNIPDDHPAKADSDTLWLSDGLLLRTHTSPVQVRVMRAQTPPLAIVCPGRVYRRDTQDATHSPVFHQVEGLVVDEGITLAHLKGTLEVLTKRLFGKDRKIRLRSGFFPFTEPSVEVDVSAKSGWIEILGAGMVDPNVLQQVGFDADRYTGFAFGVGVERVTMLRHELGDIRALYRNVTAP
jgi:phenylalanyl-tRNA synthetase alpha chain